MRGILSPSFNRVSDTVVAQPRCLTPGGAYWRFRYTRAPSSSATTAAYVSGRLTSAFTSHQ